VTELILLIVAVWTVVSFPVALIFGRMFRDSRPVGGDR
jgi:hypothetical protein